MPSLEVFKKTGRSIEGEGMITLHVLLESITLPLMEGGASRSPTRQQLPISNVTALS
jgi:hypothetical protein